MFFPKERERRMPRCLVLRSCALEPDSLGSTPASATSSMCDLKYVTQSLQTLFLSFVKQG